MGYRVSRFEFNILKGGKERGVQSWRGEETTMVKNNFSIKGTIMVKTDLLKMWLKDKY